MDSVNQTDSQASIAHLGRDGVLRNVIWRLGRNESMAIYAGPKLGKTSFLVKVKESLDCDAIRSHYLDLADPEDRKTLLTAIPDRPTAVYLLDNCDALCDEDTIILDWVGRASERSVVFAGSRAWHDRASSEGRGFALRRIPLAVLLDKDARQLIRASRLREREEATLALAGTHPYVLNAVCAQSGSFDPDADVATVWFSLRDTLAPFYLDLVEQLKTLTERQLLDYLVCLARPVNPHTAAEALGHASVKAVADMLCWLGLISRCIRNDEATLFANSTLFNLWYREYVSGR